MSANSADEDDDRYETEEFLVYVDLDTKLLDDQLSNTNAKIKFIGIDTENPVMQLNNQLFKGSFDYSMGTHCFFNESKRPGGVEDECFQELPPKLYDYFAKTNKVLKMKRIFVEEKESEASTELAEGVIEDLEHLRVTKTYAEALDQFLKPGEKPPREIAQNPHESEEEEEDTEQPAEMVENLQEMTACDPSDDEPSEGDGITNSQKEAKIEAEAQEEFQRLTNLEL